VTAADLLRQSSAQEFFLSIREQYDLVLVDTPPLLQVAYASTLLRYVDAGLVIVGHESPVAELEEVANRMAFFGVPVLGYVYNKTPQRKDMPP
jgi:Mrp family chromosome partitioning ATPase